jgi:hypothetical protein
MRCEMETLGISLDSWMPDKKTVNCICTSYRKIYDLTPEEIKIVEGFNEGK